MVELTSILSEFVSVSIGIIFVVISLGFLWSRQKVLEKAERDDRFLRQTCTIGLMLLEIAGIILVFFGVMKILGIIH